MDLAHYYYSLHLFKLVLLNYFLQCLMVWANAYQEHIWQYFPVPFLTKIQQAMIRKVCLHYRIADQMENMHIDKCQHKKEKKKQKILKMTWRGFHCKHVVNRPLWMPFTCTCLRDHKIICDQRVRKKFR